MKLRKLAASMVFLFGASVANANELAEIGEPIPIYTEAELIKLINENKHLEQVKADSCQLVEDIVARATRISLPSYEFLYGDMLAWGSVSSRMSNWACTIWKMRRTRGYLQRWSSLVAITRAEL
ncbi:hypothetical protein GGC03_01430 [Vibrio sp. THAF191c]|nr:hypothetical protein FIU99_01430 [Vibrio sp. THAF64]QGM33000.1 hypothetical protein GGC04_01435 [Vibrio sp. THAF191d]QGN68502.1 hypothetical protein GGC03_01430 [Vibrio sp. THAF191c]